MTAIFKRARPYGADQLNLPVANVAAALPFYETVMGFHVVAPDGLCYCLGERQR